MILEVTTTFEKDIDIEEVLSDALSYSYNVSTWKDGYEDIIHYYEGDFRAALEQNRSIVLKACLDLYIKRLQEYKEEF